MTCLEGIVSSVERAPRSRTVEEVTIRLSRQKIDNPIEHLSFYILRDENPFLESDPVRITPRANDIYLIERIDDSGKPTVSYEGPGRNAA